MLCQKCSAVAPTRNLFRLSSQPFKQGEQWRTRTNAREERRQEEGEESGGEEGEAGEAQPGDDEQLERKESRE